MSNPLASRFFAGMFPLMISFATVLMSAGHAQTTHGAHQTGSAMPDEAARTRH